MKDQNHHQEDKYAKSAHEAKDLETKHQGEKDSAHANQKHETPGREGSEAEDKAAKLKSAKEHDFSDLDHDKLSEMQDKLEKDAALKAKFQADPQGVLKEHGFQVPKGYIASYSDQYVKPADGSKTGMYGYRIGNMNFSK